MSIDISRGWGQCAATNALAAVVKLAHTTFSLTPFFACVLFCGCSLFPETRHRDSLHNPFPQLKRIAILPFTNQSESPTLDTDVVTSAYYEALQAIPGFEVLPVGVVKRQMQMYASVYKRDSGDMWTEQDFQQLAQAIGVEAVVVGSVTDFDAYYPPRMALTTHWYAANEGFHPIPAGYGLPWGTEAEKQIPRRIVREAEFELARSQLATQSPLPPEPTNPAGPGTPAAVRTTGDSINVQNPVRQAQAAELLPPVPPSGDIGGLGSNELAGGDQVDSSPEPRGMGNSPSEMMIDDQGEWAMIDDAGVYCEDQLMMPLGDGLPANWPEPTDLIPDPPAMQRPQGIASHAPVLSHTKLYRGNDTYFTNRLADYVETGDDARSVGWQGYLKRSEDFIRFCCHLHIVEMLESRGGSDQSDLILKWPLSRY